MHALKKVAVVSQCSIDNCISKERPSLCSELEHCSAVPMLWFFSEVIVLVLHFTSLSCGWLWLVVLIRLSGQSYNWQRIMLQENERIP